MIGAADNVRFELFSIELKKQEIPPVLNYDTENDDVIERDTDRGTFVTSKANNVQVAKEGRDYLRTYRNIYGVKGNVRLMEYRKDRTRIDERWMLVSNLGAVSYTHL